MSFIQFQFRRDTAARWSTYNPVLAEGELAIETDTSKFKIGDGIKGWNALPYGGIKGDSASPTSTSGMTEGGGNLFFTQDRVRASVLTGLSVSSASDITAADTTLSAFGKIQAKFNAISELVRNAALTGLSTTSDALVTASDSVLAAIGKLQAQVNKKAPKDSPVFDNAVTIKGGMVYTPAAMAGNVIDISKLNNTKTISSGVDLTFSGTPVAGQTWGLTLINSASSMVLVGIPPCIIEENQKATTYFFMPANGRKDINFFFDGVSTHILGSPSTPYKLPTSPAQDYNAIMCFFPGWCTDPGKGGGAYPTNPWYGITRNRQPIIGLYNEGTQSAVDWQLEVCRDYGINTICIEMFFNYTVPAKGSRANGTYVPGSGPIIQNLGHFLEKYLTSKVVNKPKFMLMFIVQTNAETFTPTTWPEVYNQFFPYFRDPNYFKVDGKPALAIYDASFFKTWVGGNSTAGAKNAITVLKNAASAEFGGVFTVGMCASSGAFWQNELPQHGYDAVTAYTVFGKYQNGGDDIMSYPLYPGYNWMNRFDDALFGPNQLGTEQGQTTQNFHSWCGNAGYPQPITYPGPTLTTSGWVGSSIPEIWPPIQTGWAPKAWPYDPATNPSPSDCIPTDDEFLIHCKKARNFVDTYRTTKTEHGIMFVVAANEYGEGQFALPTVGQGYGKMEALRAVFGNRKYD